MEHPDTGWQYRGKNVIKRLTTAPLPQTFSINTFYIASLWHSVAMGP
jgi:hypothetical protein